jgi:hypothetical protein
VNEDKISAELLEHEAAQEEEQVAAAPGGHAEATAGRTPQMIPLARDPQPYHP